MTQHHCQSENLSSKVLGAVSDESFGKSEHILKSKEFGKIYKKGISRKAPEGIIFYSLQNGLPHNRLGFSIGSKNVRCASSRNRIKRLFREVYRKNKRTLKSGYDIVIIVRKDPVKTLSYERARSVFLKFSKDAGVAA